MDDNEKRTGDDDLLAEIRDRFKDAKKHSANWRVEARECFDFRDGRQWDERDIAKLEEEGRPVVTFNRMGPYFDAVAGTEINNRQQVRFIPRTVGDSKQNELLTAAVKWALDRTNAADEQSDAFQDVLCSGMGWTETRMDYETDPDGKVCLDRVDPLEMYWDPSAKKRNLGDRKWVAQVRWYSKDDVLARWPDAELGISSNPWGDDADDRVEPHNASLAFLYRPNDRDGFDAKTGKYRVMQYQKIEREDWYRVFDPSSGKIVELSPEKYRMAEKQGLVNNGVKQKKQVYHKIFLVGDKIVEKTPLPCGWTLLPITGKRDHNTNLWYGLARVMKDPQRWANKFLSQIMHIVNSNAKGGLLAEEGAFVDARKAEQTWADPNAVVMLKNGGLGKVKERTSSNYPVGLDKLLQFAVGSIPDVTGVNLEFLGAVDRQQAGVLEQERKKASTIILSVFFDSLRLYRKEQGRLLAHFVKEYLNDGRIIRITTDQGEQPVPLQLTEDVLNYDVIVDQAPDSPNLKEEVWNTLGQLVPQLLKAGMQIPPEIFTYSPLPADMAASFVRKMQGELPPQVKQQLDQMNQVLQQLQQENQELKQQAQIKLIQDQTKAQIHAAKTQAADADSQRTFIAEMAKTQSAMTAAMEKVQSDTAMKLAQMRADMVESHRAEQRELMMKLLDIENDRKKAKPEKPEKPEKPPVINIHMPANTSKKKGTIGGKSFVIEDVLDGAH